MTIQTFHAASCGSRAVAKEEWIQPPLQSAAVVDDAEDEMGSVVLAGYLIISACITLVAMGAALVAVIL